MKSKFSTSIKIQKVNRVQLKDWPTVSRLIQVYAKIVHPKREGNGILRRQVWVNQADEVTRYSLAYINHHLFHGDNGRVLGYDNAHGYHHKHYMGKIEPINYTSFQEIEVLHAQGKKRR